MKILDRHLRGAMLGMCVVVALALTGISGFVTLVEQLDDLGQGQFTLLTATLVTLLKLPELLYQMFPLIVLLSTILGLGGLAAAGELVVIQAAGVSVLRIAGAAAKAGLMLGVAVLLLGEFIVPLAQHKADEISVQARFGQDRASSRTIWLRQGEHFIRVEALPDHRTAGRIRALRVDRDSHRLTSTVAMDAAVYQGGRWLARNLRVTEIDEAGVKIRHQSQGEWDIGLEPELLQLFVLKADGLSLRGLFQYIRYLQDNGLDATAPKYAFWRKLAAPLTVMVMVILAVPFVLGPLRDTGASERLFIGVMIGIGFYVVNEVAGSLGQVFDWPAATAALGPTAMLAGIALWRLQSFGRR